MINLTQSAVDKVKSLNAPVLRIVVTGGGCRGMTYKLDTQDIVKPEDTIMFTGDGVQVVTDKKSFPYLFGMEVDFDGSLNGKGFEMSNPNSAGECGCGTSFAVKG